MLAIAPHGAAGIALGELAAEMAEAAPALHRTLTALAKFGFVESHGRGRYRLGPAIFALAQLDGSMTDRLTQWRPLLIETVARYGCSAYLVERAGMDTVVLDMHVGTAPLQALTSGIGARLPLGLGPGATAILITLDGPTRELILEQNAAAYEARGFSLAHIHAFVHDALARGYALDRAQFVPECGGVALPIRNRGGQASAAISASAPVSFLTDQRVAEIVRELQRGIDLVHQGTPASAKQSAGKQIRQPPPKC